MGEAKRRQKEMKITFIDSGREPKCPPDPNYPQGKDVDMSLGASETCSTDLPYPAPRCGLMKVECPSCGLTVALTVAGRPDDPRSVRVACKQETVMDQYPRGKLNDADEGALEMRIGTQDKTVIIEFGKKIAWLGLPKRDAIEFANIILKRAKEISDG